MNGLNGNGEFVYDNDYSVPSESNFLGDSTVQPLNINQEPINTEEPNADRQ